MGALGESLIQTGQSHTGKRNGKVLVIGSLFLGLACGALWALGTKNEAQDAATSMVAVAPNTMKIPSLRSPMVTQVRTRNYMTPAQASNSPNSGEMTKREMLGGALASAAALASASQAQAGVQLKEGPNAFTTAPKLRTDTGANFGTLALPVTVALGWVGFNILGPALNQLDGMSEDGKR
eukprot:gnl/MRDRNA2_/MRDRNA2_83963_c0_seq2.p1 gnl/MRDRNA2_/MRDRNA2_83963_c0~~gnl/MRDRNA2_/MRDRNA2_83963_c0_seq2.p1  ORF type:complete len:180 (-),score=37.45 gnl/MRDRNA2_/MRDRNA2_83963_c0_seq2:184-723(-)